MMRTHTTLDKAVVLISIPLRPILTYPCAATPYVTQDIKIMKKLGGVVEDTELIDGVLFDQKSSSFGGPTRVDKPKIGLIQFCISPPKTDVSGDWARLVVLVGWYW